MRIGCRHYHQSLELREALKKEDGGVESKKRTGALIHRLLDSDESIVVVRVKGGEKQAKRRARFAFVKEPKKEKRKSDANEKRG